MKFIAYHVMYDIRDEYRHIAFNREGVLCGFTNAPIRDMVNGQWLDSVTGSTGEMILFDRWDQSCREVAVLTDMRTNPPAFHRKKPERKGKP